jgi:cytochrome P450
MRTENTGTQASAELVGELMTEAARADPYPVYEQLHRLGAALPVDENFVVAHGYAEVNAALRNPGLGKWEAANDPNAEAIAEHASLVVLNESILDLNPPDHARVRRLMSSVFTPRRTAGLAPAIEATTDALLDAMAVAGRGGRAVDFMDEFAFRLPVSVICELLGVPEADRYRFRALGRDMAIALELINDLDTLAPADAATLEIRDYFVDLVARRRAEPRDDLISALVHDADEDDGRLSESELISNLALLLLAGFETTTNLLGNGLAVLFDRADLADGIRERKVAVSDFVEEVLRWDSPVQLTSRTALTGGVEVGGVPMQEGAQVMLLLGAANRDPSRFADPQVFDTGRPDNQPLSFGAGGHYCLGAALARLEATTAFPRLLERFPELAPAKGEERIRSDRLVLRGYRTLPVTVG